MPTKRLLLVLLMLFSMQNFAIAQECSVDLQDQSKQMDVVMGNCQDLGTFSLGGYYNGRWEKLTYFYPMPWKGTFLSIKVDDKTYVSSDDPVNGIQMDRYVTQPPTVDGSRVYVRWMLPQSISVEESLEMVNSSALIHLKIKNEDTSGTHNLGARLHIDTMLGDNDGAPIYIPGEGLKETEGDYSGQSFNFKYWKAYNRQDKPDIVAIGILDGKLTYPDRLLISNWKKSTRTAWDYAITPGLSILGDSAVILYYNPIPVASGQTREIITGYGSGEPVLNKITEITEIVLSNITGEYCMGEDVGMKVDVGSRIEFQGSVNLEIRNKKGALQYSKTVQTGVIRSESVKDLEYTYTLPENASSDEYNVTASLYNSQGDLIDSKTTKFTVDASKCSIIRQDTGPDWLLILLLLLIVLATAVFLLSRKKGEVIVKKTKEGDRVRVSVFNNSENDLKKGVIEDRIVEGAEVDISTINVRRRGTKLTLDVGTLKAGDKATLEYRIRNVNAVPKAFFKWEGGEKFSQ